MTRTRRITAQMGAALLLCFAPYPAFAQLSPQLSEEAQISLVTVMPGDQIWSLFGHSAYRVYDPATGVDVLFNYGTFDFRDPVSFVFQFIRGKLDYMLSTEAYPDAVYVYSRYEQRSVIEQTLNLTPDQVRAVFQALAVNALPENRTYRYDFLFDNCSTRPRDVLEETLGAAVRFTPEPDPNLSFRRLLDPYVADRPFLDLGFDLLLGLPTDRIATPREATFLPLNLLASFGAATVTNGTSTVPLVARTDTVYWSGRPVLPPAAPRWPLMLTTLLLAAGTYITYKAYRNGYGSARPFDRVLFGAVGVAGLLLLFMWFFTEHRVTAGNMNLLWAWPTHLIAAIALRKNGASAWLRPYLWITAAVAAITVLGWAAWPQQLHLAVLPVVLLVGLRSVARAYQLRLVQLA